MIFVIVPVVAAGSLFNVTVAVARQLAGNAAVAPVPPPPVTVSVGSVNQPVPPAVAYTETTFPCATTTVKVGAVPPAT